MKTQSYASICIMTLLLLSVSLPSQAQTLTTAWRTDGLDSPESIVPLPGNDNYLVSNVNGQGSDRDGNGYIALLSAEGQILDKHWVTGLDAPKGMAIANGLLYVSDIDHVVVIDINKRAVKQRIAVAQAKFLNDVMALADGSVLVSDSGGSRIYRINDNNVDIWLADERLSGVNGLWPWHDSILVTTMTAGQLLKVSPDTLAIEVIAGGMENADGIVIINSDHFLVSAWPGVVYRVGLDGSTEIIQDTQEVRIFHNDMLYHNGLVLVPNWQPGSVTAYAYTP